ncbi:hypothetical protein B0O99DRAFT_172339 [Bisporella sp. PMI_857]|nr:hypothetical protein B0O99DRAFT_172339 [Bisporella sp. PMI_857]
MKIYILLLILILGDLHLPQKTLATMSRTNYSAQPSSENSGLLSPREITEFIDKQQVVLIRNLAQQKKFLKALISGRETELRLLSSMTVAKGLLKSEENLKAEIRILRRRLLMVESKQRELRRYDANASANIMERGRPGISRNFSRKLEAAEF